MEATRHSAGRSGNGEAAAPAARGPWRTLVGALTPRPTPRLGEVLVREQVITTGQLEKALAQQRERSLPLGRLVVEAGLASEAEVLSAIRNTYRINPASLDDDIAGLMRDRATLWKALTRRRTQIQVKLSLGILFVLWVTIVALSVVILGRQSDHLREQAARLGAQTLRLTAPAVTEALRAGDRAAAEAALRAAVGPAEMLYAFAADRGHSMLVHSGGAAEGTPLPAYKPEGAERRLGDVRYFVYQDEARGEVLHLIRPLTRDGASTGALHLGLSLAPIEQRLWGEGLVVALVSLLVLTVGVVLAVNLGGGFLRPVSSLLRTAVEVGRGQHHFDVKVRRGREFEDLAASFNTISGELRSKQTMEQSFGRYVNPQVLELILANPDEPWLKGTSQEATVLFTDVRGFTAVAEAKSSEAVVEALNEYFRVVTRTILEHGGYVDKYIGDAVLAVFGVPAEHPEHAERAVRAAVAVQKALRRKARANTNPLLHRVGIGINSGTVVSGNIGSEEKMEYTVIGDSVNVASRLNSLAGPGELIISHTTYDALPRHLVTVSELSEQQIRGREAPVRAYKVLKTEF